MAVGKSTYLQPPKCVHALWLPSLQCAHFGLPALSQAHDIAASFAVVRNPNSTGEWRVPAWCAENRDSPPARGLSPAADRAGPQQAAANDVRLQQPIGSCCSVPTGAVKEHYCPIGPKGFSQGNRSRPWPAQVLRAGHRSDYSRRPSSPVNLYNSIQIVGSHPFVLDEM